MEVRSVESIVRALNDAGVDYLVVGVEVELPRAVWLEIAPGLSAPVVAMDTLLEMKRAAGRPQDLTDIEELKRGR